MLSELDCGNYFAAVTCSDLADIDNGIVAYSGSSPHQYGAVATYVCDTGYIASHTISRVCGSDGLSSVGVWSGTVASCNGKILIEQTILYINPRIKFG